MVLKKSEAYMGREEGLAKIGELEVRYAFVIKFKHYPGVCITESMIKMVK